MGLTLGVLATSRKSDEHRVPIHPAHLDRIPPSEAGSIFLEADYGRRFGYRDDQLLPLVAGIRSREQLVAQCDIILLPKPLASDLESFTTGQVLWGWPHCVQDEQLTQVAIDRRLTLITWEAMNHWTPDGTWGVHVFHKNNELAGYCSVLHAMQLIGTTGEYGRHLSAAVISFGSTARGAVSALNALGVLNVTVVTHRDVPAVASPIHTTNMLHYERNAADERSARVLAPSGSLPFADFLASYDIVVNCVLQDTDAPITFVRTADLELFKRGALIVDVSCDDGMGFEWARPTSFRHPIETIAGDVQYYAVDHSPSYLWNSASWEISEALLPYLPVVLAGPQAWNANETIHRAIEIRDGLIENRKILSFQRRADEYPHARLSLPEEALLAST